jgi:hypothetical protein
VSQAERISSDTNTWEADPWDASEEIANAQLAGFTERAAMPIIWTSIRGTATPIFGIDQQKLVCADVEYYARHHGEDMLLMQFIWHGFPDPPEWGLATRSSEQLGGPWDRWGYFATLPNAWKIPEKNNAKNN